jgi:hypothetical protein
MDLGPSVSVIHGRRYSERQTMRNQMIQRTRPTKLGKRRILVVATEIVGGATPHDVILGADGEPPAEVLVIAPALNARLRHWLSDEDDARRAAGVRLEASLAHLRAAGIEAEGRVGDADPLQAVADALHQFGAEEIVITTHPDGRSHWLARDLVARARRRFAQPIRELVVEPRHGPELCASSLSPDARTARRIGRSGNGRRVAGVSRA